MHQTAGRISARVATYVVYVSHILSVWMKRAHFVCHRGSVYVCVCVYVCVLGQRILSTALKVETVQSGTITDSGPERRWRL